MSKITTTCMTCHAVTIQGANPGDKGYGTGPDGYLPQRRTANTCWRCHPELDGLDEDMQLALQNGWGHG